LASGVIAQPKPTSPIPDRYLSRLMLTYRTNIAGTPVPQSLPFRILVLGDFSGGGAQSAASNLRGKLEARPIRSFDRTKGKVTVDDVMFAMNPWVDLAVDDAKQKTFSGTLSISEIEVDLGKAPKDAQSYPVSGVARFISTRDQTGSTKIDATDLVVSGNLTLKLTGTDPDWASCVATLTVTGIVADSTPSTSGSIGRLVGLVAKTIPIDAGKLVSGKPFGSEAFGQSKRFRVFFGAESETAPPPPFQDTIQATRILTFNSLQGFSPDAIAAADPELRRLQLIGVCIGELQSSIRNHPPLRNAMKAFLDAPNKDNVEKVRTWARATFSLFDLDPGTATPAAPDQAINDALKPFRELLTTPDDKQTLDAGPPPANSPPGAPPVNALMTRAATSGPIIFKDRDQDTSDYVRFVSTLAALLVNTSAAVDSTPQDDHEVIVLAEYKSLFDACAKVSRKVEARTKKKIDLTLHDPKVRSLESNWRGLADLVLPSA
jgi:predicted component of type VI protein secretion system